MAGKLVREFIIPRCQARAFELLKGQTLKVIEVEGKQVGDMTALNLHDFREKFDAHVTCGLNERSFQVAKKLYSGPPFFNVMLNVVEDKVGVHWIHGRCNRLMYKILFGQENHANCHDNIAESLNPFGVAPHDVPFGTFNIFMAGSVDGNCHYTFRPPLANKGDHIDFRAEMDLLVSISACPDEAELNDGNPKPLKVEIFG